MTSDRRIVQALLGMLLGGVACGGGGGDNVTPPSPEAIALATPSGTGQVGAIGAPLPLPLRAVVTRNGAPVSGEIILWRTDAGGGSFTPTQSATGADGVATSQWTLPTSPAELTASAGIGSNGPSITFGAIAAQPVTGSTATVTLFEAGGTRFEPAYLIVPVGTTVTWTWADGQHDLTPSGAPNFPGDPTLHGPPRQYQFTFTTAGTYRYYCANHGTPTSGMRGAVIVQ